MAEKESKKVRTIMTGFGPFMNIEVNPSWKVVQEASKQLEGNKELELVCVEELLVEYNFVSKRVREIHAEFKPDLAIHVGVAKGYQNITIESQSVRSGYSYGDVKGELPPGNMAVSDAPIPPEECLVSSINTGEIHKQCCAKLTDQVGLQLSNDPGLYLCGFCYYTSLHQNASSLFIHIPDEDEPYSIAEMTNALVLIIEQAVGQIQQQK